MKHVFYPTLTIVANAATTDDRCRYDGNAGSGERFPDKNGCIRHFVAAHSGEDEASPLPAVPRIWDI